MTEYVGLGRQRDPSEVGTDGLLAKAFAEGSSFDLVEFEYYESEMKSITSKFSSEQGTYNWVIGGRGTGKSEVLNHVSSESIRKSPDDCRLPLYISVSTALEHGARGFVSMELIDKLTQRELVKAFDFICTENIDGFSKLRTHLEKANWTSPESPLRNKITTDNFQFHSFLNGLVGAGNILKIALIIDDMDKISTDSAIEFYSSNQTTLQNMVDHFGLVIISSVTHDFMDKARASGALDFCVNRSRDSTRELRVPDLSDLQAKDTQDFINDRLRYLHFNRKKKSWSFEATEPPVTDFNEIISNSNWNTYDVSQMRRNGALLVLLGWLKRKGSLHLSLRQVIRELETILSDEDRSSRALQSEDVNRILRKNNADELDKIEKHLLELLANKANSTQHLPRDIDRLYTLQHYPRFWDLLKEIILDRVTLGTWDGASRQVAKEATRDSLLQAKEDSHRNVLGTGRLADLYTQILDPSSAMLPILEWMVSIADKSENPPDGVLSTTVDELMSNLTPRFLIRVLESAQIHILSLEFVEPPLDQPETLDQSRISTTENQRLGHILPTPPKNVIPSEITLPPLTSLEDAWLEALSEAGETDLKGLTPKEKNSIGAFFALNLCKKILEDGDLADYIPRIEENFYEAKTAFKKNFMKWLAYRVDPHDRKQIASFMNLNDYIMGLKEEEDKENLPALHRSFQNIIAQSPLTVEGWMFKRGTIAMYTKYKPPEPFQIDFDVHPGPLGLTSALLEPEDTFSKFENQQEIHFIVSVSEDDWLLHIDSTGIPANMYPHLYDILNWTSVVESHLATAEGLPPALPAYEKPDSPEYHILSIIARPQDHKFDVDSITINLPVPREDVIRSLLAGVPSARTRRQIQPTKLKDMGVVPWIDAENSFKQMDRDETRFSLGEIQFRRLSLHVLKLVIVAQAQAGDGASAETETTGDSGREINFRSIHTADDEEDEQ